MNNIDTLETTEGKLLDRAPRIQSASTRNVYQIVDGCDLFTHGLYEDLDAAKEALTEMYKNDRKYFKDAQINRIPLNTPGCYSECIDCVWTRNGLN